MAKFLYHDFTITAQNGGKVSISHTSEELDHTDPAVISGARKDTLALSGIKLEPTKASWDYIEGVLKELRDHLVNGQRFCPPTIKTIEFAPADDALSLTSTFQQFISQVVNEHLTNEEAIEHYLDCLFSIKGMTWVVGSFDSSHCDEIEIIDASHYPIVQARVKAPMTNPSSVTTASSYDLSYIRWIHLNQLITYFPLFN
jgi:hypothetical protein